MADAEVPLVVPSTANRNRVEQLGREARRPRERRTVEQHSDRGSFSAASSPLQPRPPQPTQAPSTSCLLQGLLREGGPFSDFDPIREMKEFVQEITEPPLLFPCLSHFSFPPTLERNSNDEYFLQRCLESSCRFSAPQFPNLNPRAGPPSPSLSLFFSPPST